MSEDKKEKKVELTSVEKARLTYKFKYDKDHGVNKKDDTVDMKLSTAKALEAHGIGKVGARVMPKKEGK